MINKCYWIRLRNNIDDQTLEIIQEEGTIRYTALAEIRAGSKVLYLGARGPFEADILGATIQGIISGEGINTSVQSFSGSTYTVTGDTGSYNSGIILNEDVNSVTVVIKSGADSLRYISFIDIPVENISDDVECIRFGYINNGPKHSPVQLSNLELGLKPNLKVLSLFGTVSSGDISVLQNIPSRGILTELNLSGNPNIQGDIVSLAGFTSLNTFPLVSSGIGGTVESLVRGQVNNGRATGDIYVSNFNYNNITMDGESVNTIGLNSNTNIPKRIIWSTAGDVITISICPDGDLLNPLKTIQINK